MVINWLFLVLGLLMLWLPRSWMRRGKAVLRRRKRASAPTTAATTRESGDPRLSFPHEFSNARNYFDLFRGIAGGLAIVGFDSIPAALAPDEASSSAMRWIVLGCQLGILFIGLLAQILRNERGHLALFAPVFFLAGLAVALCGPW